MPEEKYWFPVYSKSGKYVGYLALLIEEDDIGWGDSIPITYAHFIGEKSEDEDSEGDPDVKGWGKVYTKKDLEDFSREMPVQDLEMLEELKEVWKN